MLQGDPKRHTPHRYGKGNLDVKNLLIGDWEVTGPIALADHRHHIIRMNPKRKWRSLQGIAKGIHTSRY
jgi:hypothetical protein